MKKRWPYLAGLGVLILLAAAALVNRSGLVELVVEPVSRLSWLVTRSLLAVSQEVYWTALIFVVLAFGLRLLPARLPARRASPYRSEKKTEDRVAAWGQLIGAGNRDEAGRESLVKALDDLRGRGAAVLGADALPPLTLPPLRAGLNGWAARHTGRKGRIDKEYEAGIIRVLDELEKMMERIDEQNE